MKKYSLILLLFLASHTLASDSKNYYLNDWLVSADKETRFFPISFQKNSGVGLLAKGYTALIYTKNYRPISIMSIKSEIKKFKGIQKSLKIIKQKSNTLFKFWVNKKQFYILSTAGGLIQVSIKSDNPKTNKKISIVRNK